MTIHLSATMLLEHLLFVFVVVVAPIWDYYDTRRLKQNPTSENKLRYYQTVCFGLWFATIVAGVCVGWQAIFMIASTDVSWLLSRRWAYYVVGAVIALFTAAIVLPYVTVLWMRVTRKPRKYASAAQIQKLPYAYLFPATRQERRWWVVLALTAGICEELVFRGFLLQYLRSRWAMSLGVAIVVSCLVFGLQHLYQGVNGAVSTALVGAMFALSFVFSGSLLLPIVLHALTDLRMLVILKSPE